MMFEYTPRCGAHSPVTDAATFQVDHLSSVAVDSRTIDLSHLIDPSYNYHSARELRWHLADRLGIAPTDLILREAA